MVYGLGRNVIAAFYDTAVLHSMVLGVQYNRSQYIKITIYNQEPITLRRLVIGHERSLPRLAST